MYFLNEIHEWNYKQLLTSVFPQAPQDREYHVVAYIFALPEVYCRCAPHPYIGEFPFLWTVRYRDISYMERDQETGQTHEVFDFEIEEDENGREIRSDAYYELSNGYRYIVDLAANLFNSYQDFNLMNALQTWDNEIFQVFLQALHIRKGLHPLSF
jgi:hypothetical protein